MTGYIDFKKSYKSYSIGLKGDEFVTEFLPYDSNKMPPEIVIEQAIEEEGINGDIYEFGVCEGVTLAYLVHFCEKHKIKFENIYGFDSFKGLPKENEAVLALHGNNLAYSEVWLEGEFDARKRLGTNDIELIKKIIENRVRISQGIEQPLHLIEGFFCDTLKQEAIDKYKFKPASFIHVDVDIYSSAVEVLDFIFSNKIVQSGTIIRFDDFTSHDGARITSDLKDLKGERLAIREIFPKYNVECELISREIDGAFRILGYKK